MSTKKFPIILAWLLMVLVVPLALAQTEVSPIEAMRAGNQSYEAGQFNEAVDIYTAILDADIEDSVLYYNLGNAYFKQGDLGRAILNYLRAHRLDPRDSEIAANLAVARIQTVDRLDSSAENGLVNFVQVAEEWLTLREASILALLLWLLISFFVTVAILSRSLRRYTLWIAAVPAVFLVAGLLSMANRYYTAKSFPPAVIVAQEVDITSGPGTSDQYVVEFNLHTGAEVRVVDQRPGWRNISLPGNNFQGWVPAEAIEQVVTE